MVNTSASGQSIIVDRSSPDVSTVVTYRVEDTSNVVSSCNVTVTITDDEAPTLADCTALDVQGTTDT
eukprot:COSAG01_NODE_50622_length_359_cov_23.782443_1_plen_66_part_10